MPDELLIKGFAHDIQELQQYRLPSPFLPAPISSSDFFMRAISCLGVKFLLLLPPCIRQASSQRPQGRQPSRSKRCFQVELVQPLESQS